MHLYYHVIYMLYIQIQFSAVPEKGIDIKRSGKYKQVINHNKDTTGSTSCDWRQKPMKSGRQGSAAISLWFWGIC